MEFQVQGLVYHLFLETALLHNSFHQTLFFEQAQCLRSKVIEGLQSILRLEDDSFYDIQRQEIVQGIVEISNQTKHVGSESCAKLH